MNLERLQLLIRVADTLPPEEFTTLAWVEVPPGTLVEPTGKAHPPEGSKFTLVGALPRYAQDWCWLGVPDLLEPGSAVVVPAWTSSTLWEPSMTLLGQQPDDLRAAMGVWYMTSEWLECGLGLAEVLVGSVTEEAQAQDLGGCAKVLRRALALGARLDDCPPHVAEAKSWLFA